MNKIQSLWRTLTTKSAQQRESERKEMLNEYNERINVREFNGKMYISFDGNPLVCTDNLRENIIDTLSDAREAVTEFKCHTI